MEVSAVFYDTGACVVLEVEEADSVGEVKRRVCDEVLGSAQEHGRNVMGMLGVRIAGCAEVLDDTSVLSSYDCAEIEVVRVTADVKMPAILEENGVITALSLSPTGKVCFAARRNGKINACCTETIGVLKTISRDNLILSMAASMCGSLIASRTRDGIQVHEVEDGVCVLSIPCPIEKGVLSGLVISECGSLVAYDVDSTLRVVGIRSNTLAFVGQSGPIGCMVAGPGCVVTCGTKEDPLVRVWDLATGEFTFLGDGGAIGRQQVRALSISECGTRVITGTANSCQVTCLRTGVQQLSIACDYPVRSVAMFGRRVVYSTNNELVMWEGVDDDSECVDVGRGSKMTQVLFGITHVLFTKCGQGVIFSDGNMLRVKKFSHTPR